jgi:hypothetical protein
MPILEKIINSIYLIFVFYFQTSLIELQYFIDMYKKLRFLLNDICIPQKIKLLEQSLKFHFGSFDSKKQQFSKCLITY